MKAHDKFWIVAVLLLSLGNRPDHFILGLIFAGWWANAAYTKAWKKNYLATLGFAQLFFLGKYNVPLWAKADAITIDIETKGASK